MFTLKDETIIYATPKAIFDYLTNVDTLYKSWHPRDHIFFRALKGDLKTEGSIVHFLEWLGRFPLYGVARISKIESDRYIEYELPYPFSRLKLGKAGFRIEPLNDAETKLTAHVAVETNGWTGRIIDAIIFLLIPRRIMEKHIREEGENVKTNTQSIQA